MNPEFLYITADQIGQESGGGLVTYHESQAMTQINGSPVWVLDRSQLTQGAPLSKDVWYEDRKALEILKDKWSPTLKLAHFYSGSFPETVKFLKEQGVIVTYTIAAHDKEISRREHEKVGLPFPYPHLSGDLWDRYIEGYRLADVIICPGSVPARVVRGYGYGSEFISKRIEVIPHGCEIPEQVKPLPKVFTVGYLGCCTGMDKGVRYLLEAWKELDWKDAILMLGGRDSTSPMLLEMIRVFGGGNINLRGWIGNVPDFYDDITLFVCPAATEGFNIEVLEAMASGRPVICSDGAGAVDLVSPAWSFPARDSGELTKRINLMRTVIECYDHENDGRGRYQTWREVAKEHSWTKIRQRYVDLWKSLL